MVDASEFDPTPSSGPAKFDIEDGPDTHYIDPSFRDELKRISKFKLNFVFKHNY